MQSSSTNTMQLFYIFNPRMRQISPETPFMLLSSLIHRNSRVTFYSLRMDFPLSQLVATAMTHLCQGLAERAFQTIYCVCWDQVSCSNGSGAGRQVRLSTGLPLLIKKKANRFKSTVTDPLVIPNIINLSGTWFPPLQPPKEKKMVHGRSGLIILRYNSHWHHR